MVNKILRTIEKLIPKKIYRFFQPAYHYLLTLLGAIIYRFPSRKISIVGITGTKGKSTTTELVNGILEEAGLKTAVSNSIRFKIDEESIPNKYKMSMPGRFFMQKFIRKALNKGCDWVVLELTSEGSKQFRHKFIDLDAFIFTNLAPEHIESHGSYENYRQAKINLTESLANKNKETVMVINGDDKEAPLFLEKKADKKVTYSLSDGKPFRTTQNGVEVRFGKSTLYSKLHGQFNVYNIIAAATFANAIGIFAEYIKSGIEKVEKVPGRGQRVISELFDVYVDYAHTAESLEELYKSFPNKKKICVLGNTGGGRDKWKRPVMAEVAEKYCDEIILTNEDPYDEDPMEIVNEMSDAIKNKNAEIIIDRRSAIRNALEKANKGSVVLITGKGTDPYIMGPNGKKTPWSDEKVVKEEFKKI
jgi:UDP-N-acetylmuramoyl-L-alanyl-D-glutamate--2,6-diaminopimelate ligase